MELFIIIVILLGLVVWITWNYFRIRRAAKFVSNEEFENLIKGSQLLDIRASDTFQKKHILGARNFPANQFKQNLPSLRKDRPVLLYDNVRSSGVSSVILILKKAGFKDVYVLKDGFDYWKGKTK